jgi:hypothetical protein
LNARAVKEREILQMSERQPIIDGEAKKNRINRREKVRVFRQPERWRLNQRTPHNDWGGNVQCAALRR